MPKKTKIVTGPGGLPMAEETARQIEKASKGLPADFGFRRMSRVAKDFQFGSLEDGSRTEISMVTTDDVDREAEVVIPKGIELGDFLKSPTVFYAHQYDQPIGKALWIKEKGNGLSAMTKYAQKPSGWEGPWLPDACFSMMQEGIGIGKSIGFIPLNVREPTREELSLRPDWKAASVVIDKSLLLEFSVAPLACNANALTMAVSKSLASGAIDSATANFLTESLSTMIDKKAKPEEAMPACYKCGSNEQMISLRGTPEKKFYRCERCRTEYSADAKIGPLKVVREGDPIVVEGKVFTAAQVCKSIKGPRTEVQPLVPTYAQYTEDANGFEPERNIKLSPELASDAYRIESTPWGVRFAKMRPQTDELYHFRNSTTEQVLGEIDKFWDLKADYDKLGIMHNRGIILHGPPGSGKTSALHQAAEMVVGRGDVVFYAKSIGLLIGALGAFREIEPDRKTVVVLEDADEFVGYSERSFLQLLDGEQSIGGILYLATTNYINAFPPRLLRSGRFDKKIYVGPPPYEGRLAYLNHKLNGIEPSKPEIDRLAKVTDGLSFGDLRELVTAVYALKEPVKEVVTRLCGKSMLSMKEYITKTMTEANTPLDGNEEMPECPKCMSSDKVSKKDEDGMYTCSMCGDFMVDDDTDPDMAKSVKSLALNHACISRAKVLIAEGKVNHGEWSAPVGSERKSDECLATDAGASDAAKYKYPIIKDGELYSRAVGNAAARAEQNGEGDVAASAKSISDLIEKHAGKKLADAPCMPLAEFNKSLVREAERVKQSIVSNALQSMQDRLILQRGS